MSRKSPTATSRILRLFGLLTAAFALLLVPATAAFARPAPFTPDGSTDTTTAAPTVLVTHTVSSSGIGTWTVLLIAVAAVAIGIALTEIVRATSRRVGSRRTAMA